VSKDQGNAYRVLVLDGQYCHALAAVRSLGRRHVRVEVASHAPRAQAFASRYCTVIHRAPDPNRQRAQYIRWLFDLLAHEGFDTVQCFEEATADILSEHAARVRLHTHYPAPSREAFLRATHKDAATRLVQQLGLLLPRTLEISSPRQLADLTSQLEYPVVVKGVCSSGSQQVALAATPRELESEFHRIAALRRDPALPLPVIQEYVPGSGYGLTALVDAGEPLVTFMHRRLAEHDIQHGVHFAHGATAAESVHEPEILEAATRILRELQWNGMAMVEFRRHRTTGRFYFIEINPRFVGSLELAIAAGVDFPWLLTRYATQGRAAVPAVGHRSGVRYRWLLSKNVAGAFERPLDYFLCALASLRPHAHTDICWSDPRPHFRQLRGAAWWLREHLRSRNIAPAPSAAPRGSST
jgi:predicted ATP-grasp superfamily ATP-dependent carboligase